MGSQADALIEPFIEPSLLLLPPYYYTALVAAATGGGGGEQHTAAAPAHESRLAAARHSCREAPLARTLPLPLYYCLFTTASLLLKLTLLLPLYYCIAAARRKAER